MSFKNLSIETEGVFGSSFRPRWGVYIDTLRAHKQHVERRERSSWLSVPLPYRSPVCSKKEVHSAGRGGVKIGTHLLRPFAISSVELTLGNGSSGTGTPRNVQSGSHPCFTENSSSWRVWHQRNRCHDGSEDGC